MSTSEKFQCLVRDIPGSEGPLTTSDNRIFMVAPARGEVLRVHSDGRTEVLANTGGKPAGLQLHKNGDIWVADMELGIVRVTQEGKVIPVVTEFEGKPIRGCNDLIFDSRGNLYVTAPAGSNGKPGGAVGEVYFHSVEGETKRIAEGLAFPNGIAINSSDSLLVFAETFTHKIIGIDLDGPGQARNQRSWAVLPNEGEPAGGDGMDFDSEGHLVATAYSRGKLEIFDAHGEHLETIDLPFKRCSNVHFFNDTSGRMLVTEHESDALWIFEAGRSGQRQFGWSLND